MFEFKFIEGTIAPDLIAKYLTSFGNKHQLGAMDIFVGQVRSDIINDQLVVGIKYTSYEEMAKDVMKSIWNEIVHKNEIDTMIVLHSLGFVQTGGISLIIIVASKHRNPALDSLRSCIEKIKFSLPVWGQEITSSDNVYWKVNH